MLIIREFHFTVILASAVEAGVLEGYAASCKSRNAEQLQVFHLGVEGDAEFLVDGGDYAALEL